MNNEMWSQKPLIEELSETTEFCILDEVTPKNKRINAKTLLDTKADSSTLSSHINNTDNPHSVTKTQVGLGNVDNTSDLDKPVSEAVQAELDLKANSVYFMEILDYEVVPGVTPWSVIQTLCTYDPEVTIFYYQGSPCKLKEVDGKVEIKKYYGQETIFQEGDSGGGQFMWNYMDGFYRIKVTKSSLGLGNVTNESKTTMFHNPSFTGEATLNGKPLPENDLSGTNYVMVYGVGTPEENGAELLAAYAAAKLKTPTSSNRISVIVAPGKYTLTVTPFLKYLDLDTPYIDLKSLTGDWDVTIGKSSYAEPVTVKVSASNVTVQGIRGDLNLETGLSGVVFRRCDSSDFIGAFSGQGSDSTKLVKASFYDCKGGEVAWAWEGFQYEIYAENCTAGFDSFGSSYSSMVNDLINCTLVNCGAKGGSFDAHGNASGTKYIGCYIIEDPNNTSHESSYMYGNFAGGGGFWSIYQGCRLSSTGVITKWATSVGGNVNGLENIGVIANCIDGDGHAAPNN